MDISLVEIRCKILKTTLYRLERYCAWKKYTPDLVVDRAINGYLKHLEVARKKQPPPELFIDHDKQ